MNKKRFNQLIHAQNLLSQALKAAMASMPNNHAAQEAKGHIKQAIKKLESATKSQSKKMETNMSQFDNWWGKIQSGTIQAAQTPMTPEAQQKALDQLNKMIDEERNKIKELEKQNQNTNQDRLLND